MAGALFLTTSCGDEEYSLPVKDEKLVEVLADVHIAEAACYNIYGSAKDSLIELYYGQVFSIHEVSEDDFWKAMDILEQHPDKMEAIYEQVLERLNKLEAESKK
jgi:hypothetical protein